MDMAGLWPKYINIRRGAYIMAAIGIAAQSVSQFSQYGLILTDKNRRPWQLLTTAEKFLQVLSGFGVFLAPATSVKVKAEHAQ